MIDTQKLADAAAHAFYSTLLLACGYLTGYLHATEMTANAAPGIMLGFGAAAAISAGLFYVVANGLPTVFVETVRGDAP